MMEVDSYDGDMKLRVEFADQSIGFTCPCGNVDMSLGFDCEEICPNCGAKYAAYSEPIVLVYRDGSLIGRV